MHVVCICDACAGMAKHIVIHEVHRNTRKCLWDILLWAWYAPHNTNKIYYSIMRSKHENMYFRHHTTKTNKTHSTNSTKYPQTIFNIIFSNLKQKHKIQEIKGKNMKYFEKLSKPIHFLEDWWKNDEENRGFLERTWWVCIRLNFINHLDGFILCQICLYFSN